MGLFDLFCKKYENEFCQKSKLNRGEIAIIFLAIAVLVLYFLFEFATIEEKDRIWVGVSAIALIAAICILSKKELKK